MSDAIDRAAEVLNLAGAHCGECGREPGEALSECRACEMHITDCAAYLADAGLLAPAPLREEWSAAFTGIAPDGTEHLRLIGTPGGREHAQETCDDCNADDPDVLFFLVRRPVHDWMPVNPAEGDGRDEREPTVPASRLRAFARLCVDGGDMTPAAARMLDRIIDGDGRAEK